MDKETLKNAVQQALSEKGTRKFTQTVDVGVNFRGIDFNKQENRFNLEVLLPKGKGREQKVAIFADGQMAIDAKGAGVDLVIPGADIPKLAQDPAKLKELLDYEFLAMPQLMAVVGKNLGQVLGTKGKLPKPVMGGSLKDFVERTRRSVKIKSKGKFLPVIHCAIGTETQPAEDISANVEAVMEVISQKAGAMNIKSAYVKLTMGKPNYFIGSQAKPVEAAAPAAVQG